MLPKTRISTKVLLDAYTELREQLNGKCSEDTCPKTIIRWVRGASISATPQITRKKKIESFCSFCFNSWNVFLYICPCHSNLKPHQVFIRLDEVIQELQDRLKKEWT